MANVDLVPGPDRFDQSIVLLTKGEVSLRRRYSCGEKSANSIVECRIAMIVSAAKEVVSGLRPAYAVKLMTGRDPEQAVVMRADLKPRRRCFVMGADLFDA